MLPYTPSQLAVPPPDPATQAKEAAKPRITDPQAWSKLLQREMNAKLNLAYQGLTEVPEKVLKKYTNRLKELDLSNNQIREFKFLLDVPNLETLILDHNSLTSHVKFPCLPKLHTLWLNHNKISNLVVIVKQLHASFPRLHYLSMMDNTAAPSFFNQGTYDQYKDYRHYVISQLPFLTMLDDTAVSEEERAEAERIYTRMAMLPPDNNRNKSLKGRSKSSRKSSQQGDGSPATPTPTRQQIHASLIDSLPTMEDLTIEDYTLDNALDGDSDEEEINIRAFQKMEKKKQEEERIKLEILQRQSSSTSGVPDDNSSPVSHTSGNSKESQKISSTKDTSSKGSGDRGLVRDPIMDSLPDLADLDIYSEIDDEKQKKAEDTWSSSYD